MKKTFFAFLCMFLFMNIMSGQNGKYHARIHGHNGKNVFLDTPVTEIQDMHVENNELKTQTVNQLYSFDINSIDSLVFQWVDNDTTTMVKITYNGNNVEVENPYDSQGVTVHCDGADVSVSSTISSEVKYCISGATTSGKFNIESLSTPYILMRGVSITNPDGKAMNLACDNGILMELADGFDNYLTDGTGSDNKACLISDNDLTIQGNGNLTVTALAQHGIKVKGQLTMNGGNIIVTESASDALHLEELVTFGGSINVQSCGTDGIDCEKVIDIQGGNITVNSANDDCKGIKSDSLMFIRDGIINVTVSGDISKGIKVGKTLNISGGDITITASGTTVVNNMGSYYEPAYCSAIKVDEAIVISGGTFDINLPTSNKGGKGISCDGPITISGGIFDIETKGDGATYNYNSTTKDSYTSSCIKCDGELQILAGTFTCNSSGKGGKGINTDVAMILGVEGASDDDLIINVTTSGERITVSGGGGGGGGGWPPGGEGDYANPKAIKAGGNLTINSGTITVNCTQSQNEGGECFESKNILTINGGDITGYSKKDDVFNAANNITINGGHTWAKSDGNDGIDSNGTMNINGGFTISNGSGAPEEGFDCDNNQFKITGGIAIGTGGGTSNPTQNVCTQRSFKITTGNGYAIQIIGPDGNIVLTYQCPTLSGGGGGGGGGWPPGGGGGGGITMLFTDDLPTGQYTIKYGGTISGGTEWAGYFTGSTYSGGSSKTFNVSGMVTSVTAQ